MTYTSQHPQHLMKPMYITLCQHCSRVKKQGTEEWLDLFLRLDPREDDSWTGMVSHGICLDCLLTLPQYERIRDKILARMKDRREAVFQLETVGRLSSRQSNMLVNAAGVAVQEAETTQRKFREG